MMSSDGPHARRRWRKGDLWAVAFLLVGFSIALFMAATGGAYFAWILWIAVPMLMFSLAYLFLVSALPIFLGPRSGEEAEGEEPRDEPDR